MRITLFTCNQPRHMDLIARLATVADELHVVQETKTSFPGVTDAIHPAGPVLADYFARMQESEQSLFGRLPFTLPNCRVLPLFMGDLSRVPLESFGDALAADHFVVFGASYIKGALAQFLVEHGCINIHMGVSPYYRGSACNFWALADDKPALVGSTIHLLTTGLDSGPILFHALPEPSVVDGFMLGMLAVRAANVALSEALEQGRMSDMPAQEQDRGQQLRYSRSKDFTEQVAGNYLAALASPQQIYESVATTRANFEFMRPVVVKAPD